MKKIVTVVLLAIISCSLSISSKEFTNKSNIFDSSYLIIDNEKYNVFVNEQTGVQAWPFDKEFHLLLNIAVGGNWGGKFGVDDTTFPQKMLVDYVRVYQ